MNLRRIAIAAAAGLATGLVALTGHGAWSQAPKTIRIIVPYSPGSGPDILSRLLGQHISQDGGTAIVVENRPGGGTVPGTDAAARAAPDGGTLLLAAPAFIVNDALQRPSHTPVSAFDPVCQFAATPLILVVRADSPYKSLNDLLDAARAKPGALQLVSGGPATSLHIAVEVVKRAAKVDMVYVPYGGTAPAINALLGGHVTAVMADYPTIVSQLKAGTLRPLVTISAERVPTLPDLPTLTETGVVKYHAEIFYGFVAPAKTPPATLTRLSDMFMKAAKAPEVQKRFGELGMFRTERCGAEFGAYLNQQVEDYARIAREANIKVN